MSTYVINLDPAPEAPAWTPEASDLRANVLAELTALAESAKPRLTVADFPRYCMCGCGVPLTAEEVLYRDPCADGMRLYI